MASRGLIALVALLLAVLQHRSVAEMVMNWDARHFESLAMNGYLGERGGILMAFFPGLPAVLSVGLNLGIPVALTGVVVSLAASAVAAAALLRLGGPWAAVAWLFAPTAVFTTVPYTESLFCAAAFWAWERARADRWWAAAVLTAAACTLRVSGLFLVGALLVMVFTSRVDRRTKIARAARMLLPLGVILAFAGYLYLLTGSWTAWYAAQKTGWVRELTWPWQSFLNTIPAVVPGAYADHPWWAAVFRGEMVSMAVGIGVVAWCIAVSIRARRRRAATLGRGQLGRGPGAGVLVVLLVLLSQPGHAALVPAVDDGGPLGELAAAGPLHSGRPPGARRGGVHRRDSADAVVELAVLHRTLGQLTSGRNRSGCLGWPGAADVDRPRGARQPPRRGRAADH